MTSLLLRRALAILLPCALLALLWLVLIAPLLAISSDDQSQRDALLARIAADRRAIASAPAWQSQLTQLAQSTSQNAGARAESTQALAASGLQNDIQSILAQDGGQVVSVQILPPTTQAGYETVSIQLSLSLPVTALPDFLRQVETHTPYMFFTTASLQAPDAMAAPSGPDAASPVNLSCTILAYRRS